MDLLRAYYTVLERFQIGDLVEQAGVARKLGIFVGRVQKGGESKAFLLSHKKEKLWVHVFMAAAMSNSSKENPTIDIEDYVAPPKPPIVPKPERLSKFTLPTKKISPITVYPPRPVKQQLPDEQECSARDFIEILNNYGFKATSKKGQAQLQAIQVPDPLRDSGNCRNHLKFNFKEVALKGEGYVRRMKVTRPNEQGEMLFEFKSLGGKRVKVTTSQLDRDPS